MHLNTHFGEIIILLKFVTFKQNYAFSRFFVPLPHTQPAPVGRSAAPPRAYVTPLHLYYRFAARRSGNRPSSSPSARLARSAFPLVRPHKKKLIISSPSLVAQHEGGGAAFSPNAVKAERPYSSPPVVDLLLLVFRRRRRRRHNQHSRGTVLLPGRAGGGAGTGFSNLNFAY